MAVRAEAGAIRHRRVRVGRGVAAPGRRAGLVPGRPRLRRRPRPRTGRGGRDQQRAHPPPAALEALDADHGGHPAVRRSGRPLRVQPQRGPAGLPGRCGRRIESRAGSTGVPTPRSGLAGSRTRGIPGSRSATCWPRSTTASAARRTSRSSPRTAPRRTTRATARTRSSRSRSGGSGSSRPASTRSTAPCSASWRRRHERRLVPLRTTVSLGQDGAPLADA